MTREDIIRIAREAGGYSSKRYTDEWRFDDDDLKQFAELVAAAEREKCADELFNDGWGYAAKTIRARGQG
jgi:hypothetical protein